MLTFVNPRIRCVVAMLVVATLAAGCASRRAAPVEDRDATRTPPPVVVAPPAATPPVPAQPAPVPTYTVKRGDTLHQIALDSGLDYRELAAWNNIENVHVIRVGQVLRLTAPGEAPAIAQEVAPGVTTAPLRSAPLVVESKPGGNAAVVAAAPGPAPGHSMTSLPATAPGTSAPTASSGHVKTGPKAIKEPYSDQAVRELTLAASAIPAPPDTVAMAAPGGVRVEPKAEPRSENRAAAPSPVAPVSPAPAPPVPAASAPSVPRASTAGDADQLDWAWPAKGKVIAGFSDTANLKGIDIAGTAGQAVQASAAGRVVYAGSGLRGYGKLIIIKHNATYLSAYAHNREILVKEGQQVTRGQKIAEMGNTDAEQVKLHFEIRRLGKPMDPTKYLPPA